MQFKKAAQFTGHNAAIFALADGLDGRHVFSGAGDGWVVRWELSNPDLGQLVAKVGVQVFSLCLLQNQWMLVAGDMNGGLHWIDLADPDSTRNIQHHQRGVFDIREVGGSVFTLGGEGKITRWDSSTARSVESYHLANQALRCMDFSEGRNELAIGSSDGSIYLLNATTLELHEKMGSAHDSSVFAVRYSPDGKLLLSGGRDAHLNAWDLKDGLRKISSEPAHWYTINDLAFSPDGQHYATASRDKTVKIWDAKTLELLKVLEGGRDGGHFNSVNKLRWLPTGLLSCSDDRTVISWVSE